MSSVIKNDASKEIHPKSNGQLEETASTGNRLNKTYLGLNLVAGSFTIYGKPQHSYLNGLQRISTRLLAVG